MEPQDKMVQSDFCEMFATSLTIEPFPNATGSFFTLVSIYIYIFFCDPWHDLHACVNGHHSHSRPACSETALSADYRFSGSERI